MHILSCNVQSGRLRQRKFIMNFKIHFLLISEVILTDPHNLFVYRMGWCSDYMVIDDTILFCCISGKHVTEVPVLIVKDRT